jgi:hypothetical protein
MPFAASVDFAIDKDAGKPCINLQSDFRCGIHLSLRQRGFRGCTVYDCFGTGQKVAQITFGRQDWRQAPESAKQMFEVFPIMRQIHELLENNSIFSLCVNKFKKSSAEYKSKDPLHRNGSLLHTDYFMVQC